MFSRWYDLPRRTAFDKVLCNKVLEIEKTP